MCHLRDPKSTLIPSIEAKTSYSGTRGWLGEWISLYFLVL